ncbi:SfnB family sulfur acquisition oxidoreductase [Corticimicrobacter populi]|uniref:SfnB family sulfur acquisition oxidoreductase n=1 Tax=Corticimicrobacter populi TaxID=2175229 RepID=A0A2V1JUZ7_9BURK|nr:SfnB family sulfur acquisition oxidoreductase [Corticimicrobacter populi]PWF21916.1 SfnB family sulfur acquisition oxidoreductase [Corticimicrobacter populi]
MSTDTLIAPPDAVTAAAEPATPAARLTSTEQALDVARNFAATLETDAVARDRDRILPWQDIERYSASGLWGITVPQEYGGLGASSGTLTQVIATIAATDGNFGHIPQNHFYALEVLRVGANHAQKTFFYDRVLRGERFGNALAEIGHNDYKRRTHLSREADGWFVQGRKFYCTGAIFAHWIPTLVTALENGLEVTYLVFIPRSAPGVSITDDWDGFGQRVTGSGSVAFERVRVEPEWVVPFKASFDRPTTIGPFAQIIHAALDVGIGHGALKATLPYLREHTRPWVDAGVDHASQDPLLLHQLGHVHLRLRAADALIARAARFVDAAQAEPTDASVAAASVAVAEAKALSTQASLLAGTKLFELAGTSATVGGLGLDRFWRNARTHTLHDPVRWKYHAIGNYVLNGRHPPRHGAL